MHATKSMCDEDSNYKQNWQVKSSNQNIILQNPVAINIKNTSVLKNLACIKM